MANHIILDPSGSPEVARQTRRAALAAIGCTMLAGIAVAGFARPDQPAGSDAVLLAACAEFDRAHVVTKGLDDRQGLTDETVNEANDNWYQAIDAVLEAPRPVTEAGRFALARVARTAWADQVTEGEIGATFEGMASAEERLVAAALSSYMGV